MVVRLSHGAFAPERVEEVRAKLEEGRASLEPALRQLRGPLHYYVAADEQASTMVDVSVWSLGVRFDPIRNYPTTWTITP